MSLPPHRDPIMFNKTLDSNDLTRKDWQYRRSCVGGINFCDDEFFRRLNIKHPFRDAYFPRFPHADFLYRQPDFMVTDKKRWGSNVCNVLSEWRSSFPDRQNAVEWNRTDKSTGMGVLKPAPETLTHGRSDLSTRRLKKIERTNGGQKNYHFKRWDRFREGAPSIPKIQFVPPMSKTHTMFGDANKKRSFSDSSLTGSKSSSQHGGETPAL